MKNAIYYHAGCPVCVQAEDSVLSLLDKAKTKLKIIDLGKDAHAVAEAERLGVQSVPALVIEGDVFHINLGAPLSALTGGTQ